MAVGSHYPLNSLIPLDCRKILEKICAMDSMCEATDPLVARIFSSSRFLGLSMQFLMKLTEEERLYPFLKYLLLRVERSTVEERLVETGEGCENVVGFHVINEKNAESTIEIVEYLYAFFQHAPEEIVYDNGKELELAASLREPSFFGRTRYYQDQMHHRNHTTAPEH
eukprot:scaffold65_cov348-Pavlova_lutheri.AAC.2